ncbi:hypothetical protein [Microvirga solisilvae]|uniref:hypothetical protein n=1 Tax=Microvirga solisilvae TaxID=2919498 RepID=UPI001FAF3698|nr:hypothetical protein [Microvirga solisilvae]
MSNLVEVTQERPIPDYEAYSPSKIRLYGVPVVSLDLKDDSIFCIPVTPDKCLALIYGFCYQGHCYSLPEPVIVLVNGEGDLAQGCGWDPDYYWSWDVDKQDQTIHLQVQSDSFEELILKRNINTTKQPVAYSIAFQMSHRGGKLTE